MTGLHLAQYRIDAELGRGGMGIVYRATDTKLNRTVALKVLPASALTSADDRARFFREAQAAAQLSHPNIATVHQIDEAIPVDAEGNPVQASDGPRPFIAMEFIEGETLAGRAGRGPLALKDAVTVAGQVAEALKAAHAKGIVHRDIKSANVMLMPDGIAKVLDFGLAKTNQSTMLTRMGSTLGTVAYMSPEQARGQEVDSRSDLYSLGTMLYEMVAGRLPFAGDYEQAVVYGILNEPPEPLTSLRTGVPMELERIVAKLLSKEAEYRYQTAADLIADLKALDVSGSGLSRRSMSAMAAGRAAAAPPGAALPAWAWGAMIAALLLGAVGSWAVVRPRPVDEPLRRVEVTFPELLNARFPALSPGGAYLAAQGRDAGGREGIFVRDMATGRVFYVQGSDVAAWEMRYSPDGTRLAFMRVFNQGVYFLELPDGLPERLTDFGRIAYWEDDETIVMTDDRPGGGDSYRVPIGGGDPAAVRFVEAGREAGFGNILKSGIPGTSRAFGLQTVRINDQGNSNGIYRLFTADLDTGELLVLDSAAVNPEYVRGGYVVYNVGGDEGKLVVRPIDPSTGRFTAQPKDALQGGESAVWGAFNVSDDGDLVYAWGVNPADDYATRLFWIDGPTRRIDSLRVTLQAGLSPSDPILSGDVSTLVFTALRDGDLGGTLHALDLSSGIQTQVTFGGRYAVSAVSEDGSSVYATRIFDDGVSSVPIGVSAVRLRRGAAGSEELLARSAVMPVPSPDGTALLLTNTRDGGPDGFSILSLADGSAVRLDSMRSIGMGFSPDGRYVLGQNVEIGLLTVHSVDGRERYDLPNVVSLHAVWSRDGSHIYYWSIGGSLRRIGVRVEPSFSMVGQAEEVMPVRQSGARSRFDVAPDGSMVVAAGSVGSGRVTEGVPTFVWLQHWAGHVRRQFGRR